uniref:Protein distal antenna n=1 Tax=Anopheles epiroticus TaxID=199890 RepID=A0A182P3W9_9DIPT
MPLESLLMMMMATATKGKRPLRHLTATDKIDAIQRIHDGESKASVARDIGVPESTLRGWCKNEEKLRYMSRQSVENAEKLSNEATAAALTAAAAAELFSGPPEKRIKLESAMFGGNGKLKYDDSFYKVAAAARGSLNGLDLSGGGGVGGAGSGIDKSGPLGVSGGDIIMNGLAGASPADFSQFAKTAAEMSALSKSKAYGSDLSKHHHHGGDPSKSDHHLSMAAISPLTSLSHLSGMSGLGQSPLALSFNDIATNLNLIAQLNHSNHSLATMSSLAGGLNTAAAAAVAAQSLRNVRPKGSGSSAANNNGAGTGRGSNLQDSSSGGGGGGGGASSATGTGNGTDKSSTGGNSTGPSLTVRNLAKLQQQKSSSGELLGNGMLHQQSHAAGLSNLSEQYRKSSNHSSNPTTSTSTTTTTNASVGRDPNAAPVDEALWYWLKSQQAMLGLNNLYTSLPRAASNSPPTPPPPMGLNAVTTGAGSPNHSNQTTLPPTAHTPHTPPPPLVGPPLVSTPQPTPPSSAPSLTPEDTKNSSWFWQWYKTFGASLMPGGATAGVGSGTGAADSKQALREQLQQQQQQAAQQSAIAAALHHHNNNNSLSTQNQNNSASGQKGGGSGAAASAAASLTAAYENILYSQLTKGSNAVDTLNNNHHHHLNHHLSAHMKHEPIDLNMGGTNDGDSKPEDLSNHHVGSGKDHHRGGSIGNGDERRSRYHPNSPSRPSSASSVASSSMSANGSREGGDRLLRAAMTRTSEDRAEDDEPAALVDGEERERMKSTTAVVEATSTEEADKEEEDDEDEDREKRVGNGQHEHEEDDAGNEDRESVSENEGKSRAQKRRRCSSTEAKEALDNILFSGNSNDRCSTTSSVAASPPPPLLSMVVRDQSVSPVDATVGVINGSDEVLQLSGKGEAATGDDAKSETSEDSIQHGQQSAVADIRNSAEAVEHGEKFLKWLEACSDPNVTAMQVMQFKYLLNSIKLSAERQLQTATTGSALSGSGPEERTRIRKRK